MQGGMQQLRLWWSMAHSWRQQAGEGGGVILGICEGVP